MAGRPGQLAVGSQAKMDLPDRLVHSSVAANKTNKSNRFSRNAHEGSPEALVFNETLNRSRGLWDQSDLACIQCLKRPDDRLPMLVHSSNGPPEGL